MALEVSRASKRMSKRRGARGEGKVAYDEWNGSVSNAKERFCRLVTQDVLADGVEVLFQGLATIFYEGNREFVESEQRSGGEEVVRKGQILRDLKYAPQVHKRIMSPHQGHKADKTREC